MPTEKKPKEPWYDDRWKPLIDFAYESYREEHEVTLVLDKTDGNALKQMLIKTKNLPEFSLDNLKIAWLMFRGSQDKFDRNQGHPLRFFCANINRFMTQVVKPKPNGNLDTARAFVKRNIQ